MLIDVVAVRPLPNACLWLQFEDGVTGTVDLKQRMAFSGVFAPLAAPEEFAKVRVDPELGTVCWPNGADLDPHVLYATVTGNPITV